MSDVSLTGRSLVRGSAQGELLYADVGLSFWGGVDPFSGEIIDRHHPLSGQCLAGRLLALPSGRGSCTGSSVLMELLTGDHAPAALIFADQEEILTLGVIIAETLFNSTIPVVCVGPEAFAKLRQRRFARVEDDKICLFDSLPQSRGTSATTRNDAQPVPYSVSLSESDHALLDGHYGKAAQEAMRIVLRMAELQGADQLIDISQAHIDGCIYTGPASLRFAEQLVEWGAQVRVPTTLNSISVDQCRWRAQGIDPAFGEPASALGNAYMAMGAQLSYTCAPYLLDSAPKAGEQIVWAESNAVVYANSVLAARTLKYPDYLDICIALTGRAPFVGTHRDQGRFATLRIDIKPLDTLDDAFWPLLGYHVGLLCGSEIPLLCGLEETAPSRDDLKAFGAAFATTSAAPMFHINQITPEATSESQAFGDLPPSRVLVIEPDDLLASWYELDHAETPQVDLVSLGNPHFSLSECAALAALCSGRRKHPDVAMAVTLGRAVYADASEAGYVTTLERFGAQLINDTCWCMLGEPVVPPTARTIMTNSGKYAHYAPGLVGRQVHFGNLAECVETACSGEASGRLPTWLTAAATRQGAH
ncbi:cis-3-hydroxy-L-proline dehydratase [Vreelandella boliviensis]|uniref:DUF521 domain-containing protein n=1 Tax=Vreelandella boliviensis LC1 TaxID=1072583 RepID=A0A265DVN7_9GAMM|nr:aconitase family protein [Halomonas boliviensis]EHJ92685.1 hypothetical protein KUC_2642 [Halomonas boliviensis LC1]OZT73320.1 hypothetical protein CE457_14445 [Halomonas boliviensis LC1]